MKRRFRIEFSGKSFPEYYPCALTVPAPDEDRAKEWGKKQLEEWNLSGLKIRVSIVEVLFEEEPKEEKPKKKKNKK